MCQQNLPKLWCRYEFIVHNHLWNSEIVPQWIQQKISRKVTETDSRKLEFDNCKQQLFTLTMCLPACLWAHIARSPFNYTITARTLLEKCDDYQFQRSILQFPVIGKNYRIASMFIITRALGTPRLMSSEEKVAPCFVRQNISWSSNESSRKHENIALKSTMTKQWALA